MKQHESFREKRGGNMHPRVGSNSSFCDFRKQALYAADQLCFYESNSNKSAKLARQSFHFQKITGNLKINILF